MNTHDVQRLLDRPSAIDQMQATNPMVAIVNDQARTIQALEGALLSLRSIVVSQRRHIDTLKSIVACLDAMLKGRA